MTSLRTEGFHPTRDAIISALVAGFAQAVGPLEPTTWDAVEPTPHAGTGVSTVVPPAP